VVGGLPASWGQSSTEGRARWQFCWSGKTGSRVHVQFDHLLLSNTQKTAFVQYYWHTVTFELEI